MLHFNVLTKIRKMKNLFLFLFLFIVTTLTAQVVPLNPDVLYGKLGNGLTYYVQKNSLPKDRAMFYLAVNAGGINENENQNGLAHFCEHMAFNGTKNFPDKGLLNYLESIGVSFGKGLNAGTSSATTIYTLNDIPTIRNGFIDSSLLILREWASNVSYTTDEINKERGVIHEEWRTYGGASSRMGKITNKVLFEGSKYSNHNVIGDLDVIDHADPDLLRSFYKDWYSPENQAIIVVGDIDKELIAGKIKKIFGDIPKRKDKPQVIKTMVSSNKELKVTTATDKEAQGLRISFYVKQPGSDTKDLAFYKQRIVFSLYNMMFSDRISELLQKENPPMISASAYYGSLTKFQDSFTTSVSALNNNPILSFKAALTENERIKRSGFTATELDRAKSRILTSTERSYNERDKQLSGNVVYEYISNFTDGYPAPGIAYRFDLIKSFLPTITLEQVNGLARQWMTDENQVIVVTGPEKEGVVIPTEAELKGAMAEVLASNIEPYVDKVIPTTLITTDLKGSPIVKEEKIPEFDGTKLTLANGAKVWIKYTENKQDEITMQAFSNGGFSLVPTEDLNSGSLASTVRNSCGTGNFSAQDLRKFLAGKNASVYSQFVEIEEMVVGSTTKKDLETMLQLTYLQFTPARRDDAVLKSLIQRTLVSLENRKSDPNSIFSDTISLVTTNYNKRTLLPTPEYFKSMNFEKAYAIANDRIQDAGDFNFVFVGNIDLPTLKPLIEKYIGSIPDLPRTENWIDHRLVPAKGHVVRRLSVPMKDPKATVYVQFYGEAPTTQENVEYLNAIRYILNMRYVESIREKEGGTYGVGVSAAWNSRPVNNYRVTMNFTCAPDRVEYLEGLMLDELTKLKETGVTAAEVEKTKLNFLKVDAERMKNNSYIMDRVKSFVNNGIYTPLAENSTNIYNTLDGKKIQDLAKKVFGNDFVDIVMVPAKTN
jgi:zinc protease